jgi:hypothetical protein
VIEPTVGRRFGARGVPQPIAGVLRKPSLEILLVDLKDLPMLNNALLPGDFPRDMPNLFEGGRVENLNASRAANSFGSIDECEV